MDPGTVASGWSVKKALGRVRGLAEQGRKIASLIEDVASLRDDTAVLKRQVADLQRRAAPADPEIDEKLGVWTGVVGGKRHNFCPVCWGKGEHQLLQHEPDEDPPWRCPSCALCFPGGYHRGSPRISFSR